MTNAELKTFLDFFMMGIKIAEDDGYMDKEYKEQVKKALKEAFKILQDAMDHELFLTEETEKYKE